MNLLLCISDLALRLSVEARLAARGLGGTPLLPATLADAERWPDELPAGEVLVIHEAAADWPGAEEAAAAESLLQRLAQVCAERQLILLHVSSGRVFDAIDGGRHREADVPSPASTCGAWQMRLEALARRCERHIVLRCGPLFAPRGDNLMTRLLADLQRGGVLSVSSAGKAAPVHVDDLARVLVAMVDQLACDAQVWGTYHYASADPCSRLQFAEAVLASASQFFDAETLRVRLQEQSVPDGLWPQPLLHCERIRQTFGIKQLPWRSYLGGAVRAFFSDKTLAGAKTSGRKVRGEKHE